MPTLVTHDPKLVWGKLDWNRTETVNLYQQIKSRLKKFDIPINKRFKRIVMVDVGVPKVEEYTLYDLAVDARLRAGKQNAAHWMAVMTMLRSLGAKPACVLLNQMTPEEKSKNTLDSEKIMAVYWQQKLSRSK